jgi:hypothetical protein
MRLRASAALKGASAALKGGSMTEQEYLESRIEDQLKWYSAKASWNQKLYKRLRLLEIALASAIPLIVVLPIVDVWSKALVAAAGATIAVLSGAISLWKFQENWVEYRATAENLKREKFLFVTRALPYAADDRFPLLVGRVETLLGTESAKWMQLATTKSESPDHG